MVAQRLARWVGGVTEKDTQAVPAGEYDFNTLHARVMVVNKIMSLIASITNLMAGQVRS